MDFNTKIKYCLENILKEKQDIFLIDFDIRSNDSIKIVIDGDNGIKVQDCIKISKAIKSKIDEENKNFSIEVTSPGIGENLKISRQYKNNVGRDLELKLDDGTFIDGKLKKANDKKNLGAIGPVLISEKGSIQQSYWRYPSLINTILSIFHLDFFTSELKSVPQNRLFRGIDHLRQAKVGRRGR